MDLETFMGDFSEEIATWGALIGGVLGIAALIVVGFKSYRVLKKTIQAA